MFRNGRIKRDMSVKMVGIGSANWKGTFGVEWGCIV